MSRSYWDSPLYFGNVTIGKAYVEKYLGDVFWIKNKKEINDDDFFICDYYDAYDHKLRRNVKFNEESWLSIGFADWEEIEIKPKHFNRMVIKSYIKKHIEKHDDFDGVF